MSEILNIALIVLGLVSTYQAFESDRRFEERNRQEGGENEKAR